MFEKFKHNENKDDSEENTDDGKDLEVTKLDLITGGGLFIVFSLLFIIGFIRRPFGFSIITILIMLGLYILMRS